MRTSLAERGIRLRSNDYVLLVSNEEQINFGRNASVNNLAVQFDFERGKDYFLALIGNQVA
ncbi:MAG: hypothetical protein AAGG68_30125 [Bacteroidota bacterium]